MSTIKPYNNFTAVFLLAVYCFIAVPVQLWHHHPVALEKNKFADTKYGSISQDDDLRSESNCAICSHHYSVYDNDASVIFSAPQIAIETKESVSLFSIPASPYFTFNGRGPPSLLSLVLD